MSAEILECFLHIETKLLVTPIPALLTRQHLLSDQTFYTQSQDYGGKSSRIFGRISLPSSGDGN